VSRWATFDCYGTLIDWNAGIRGALAGVFGEDRADELLERYHELEPELQRDGTLGYRDVMTEAMRRLGAPEEEAPALAASLPQWPAFPETKHALLGARLRGWSLAILSNTDRDLIEASIDRIGLFFDEIVVAEEIRSYKPAHRHWEEFFERTGADREHHVHVAASLFHDIEPANELGLRSIWINRLGERAGGRALPTRELPDLTKLAESLDELVPA
jgi:2-haloacid dehalogenase